MTRSRLALAALALAVAVTVPAGAQAKTVLKGTVGPTFFITLKTAGGKKVTTLKAGVYAITVADKSSFHNFRLKGPGLNRMITGVTFVGTKTVTVRLRPGRYTYHCDPHVTLMRGSFRVTG
jgi:hypothetical protein